MAQHGGANRHCPVYIAIDVSDSMQQIRPGDSESAHDCFALLLADLVLTMQDRAAIRTQTWMSLVAFSSTPQLILPLTSMERPFPVGEIPRAGQTDLAALLTLLDSSIRLDRVTHAQATRLGRPLVFIITDGQPFVGTSPQPMSEWLPIRDRLAAGANGARIAALGLDGADETVLWKLATGDRRARNAFVAQPDQPIRPLAESVANAIARSISASVRIGDMTIDAPSGMRAVGT